MFKPLAPISTFLVVSIVFLILSLSTSSHADTEKSGAGASPGQNAQLPDPLQAGWNGSPVCENLFEDERQRILRCTFPPGGGHARHYHRPHVGYALSGGKMRLIDDSGIREVDLPTDTSYSSDGVVWHEVLNIGTTTVRYLIVEQK